MNLLSFKNLALRRYNNITLKECVNRFSSRIESPVMNKIKPDVFEKNVCPNKLLIIHKPYGSMFSKEINVNITPTNKALVYKKVVNPKTGKTEKIPSEIFVATSAEVENPAFPKFYFIDKNTKQEIGFVSLMDFRYMKNDKSLFLRYKDTPFFESFPYFGINKDRIAIGSLQNNCPDMYSGIGAVADQLALEYCLKEGITPNIVSIADKNSHAAHYKRGRRFFTVNKKTANIDSSAFFNKFKTCDPNEIIESRINETPTGQSVYTEDLGQLFMYMPQSIVQKYLKKINENPILK